MSPKNLILEQCSGAAGYATSSVARAGGRAVHQTRPRPEFHPSPAGRGCQGCGVGAAKMRTLLPSEFFRLFFVNTGAVKLHSVIYIIIIIIIDIYR